MKNILIPHLACYFFAHHVCATFEKPVFNSYQNRQESFLDSLENIHSQLHIVDTASVTFSNETTAQQEVVLKKLPQKKQQVFYILETATILAKTQNSDSLLEHVLHDKRKTKQKILESMIAHFELAKNEDEQYQAKMNALISNTNKLSQESANELVLFDITDQFCELFEAKTRSTPHLKAAFSHFYAYNLWHDKQYFWEYSFNIFGYTLSLAQLSMIGYFFATAAVIIAGIVKFASTQTTMCNYLFANTIMNIVGDLHNSTSFMDLYDNFRKTPHDVWYPVVNNDLFKKFTLSTDLNFSYVNTPDLLLLALVVDNFISNTQRLPISINSSPLLQNLNSIFIKKPTQLSLVKSFARKLTSLRATTDGENALKNPNPYYYKTHTPRITISKTLGVAKKKHTHSNSQSTTTSISQNTHAKITHSKTLGVAKKKHTHSNSQSTTASISQNTHAKITHSKTLGVAKKKHTHSNSQSTTASISQNTHAKITHSKTLDVAKKKHTHSNSQSTTSSISHNKRFKTTHSKTLYIFRKKHTHSNTQSNTLALSATNNISTSFTQDPPFVLNFPLNMGLFLKKASYTISRSALNAFIANSSDTFIANNSNFSSLYESDSINCLDSSKKLIQDNSTSSSSSSSSNSDPSILNDSMIIMLSNLATCLLILQQNVNLSSPFGEIGASTPLEVDFNILQNKYDTCDFSCAKICCLASNNTCKSITSNSTNAEKDFCENECLGNCTQPCA